MVQTQTTHRVFGRIGFAIVLACVFFVSLNCSAGEISKDYTILIGISESADAFESDDLIEVKGKLLDHHAIVRINNEPATIYDGFGRIIYIDLLVRKGENAIVIEGNFERPLFVKVGVLTGKKVAVLAKKVFQPQTDGQSLKFRSDYEPSSPNFDSVKTNGASSFAEIEKAIAGKIDDLLASIKAKDGKAVVERLNTGLRQWQPSLHGPSKDELAAQEEKSANFFSAPETQAETPEGNLRFAFGDHFVLVWRQQGQSVVPIVKLKSGDRTVEIVKLRFVSQNATWVVWDSR